ncbi:MOSC domain-containing protein [Tardiphaga alba]|uniref:MOSC domain-containing protein n=1 Tax=Tardiphaga alba TaxID=340268 RepID=UPI001BAD2197|nr:MOSC domain-containing protein [Tardiphaga alba]
MAALTRISRYPVKGLSAEDLAEVGLSAGRGLPGDRIFALALADTDFDELNPRPIPKTKFAVLARFPRLAALKTKLDVPSSIFSMRHEESTVATGNLETQTGRDAIEEAVHSFMGDELGGRPRVVKGTGHRFTDVSVHSPMLMEAISVINLASVRDLESKLGRRVDPRRFRANLLLDGLDPWIEFDWIDRELQIGNVKFRGVRRTRRCPATEVNPDTAQTDIRVPLELRDHYGHADMGIYITVLAGGTLRIGDVAKTLGGGDIRHDN